jgi:hypothetical protein
MNLLFELLKGFFFALGFFTTIVALVVYGIYKFTKISNTKTYDVVDLIRPFEVYKSKMIELEMYEDVQQLESTIANLKAGVIDESVKLYKITKDSSVVMGEKNGNNTFKIATTYKVVSKI